MNPADQREEVLFAEALKRPGGSEREAFLDAACLGDPLLRASFEALTQAHERSDIAKVDARATDPERPFFVVEAQTQ